MQYGRPPDWDECIEAPEPERLTKVFHMNLVGVDRPNMHTQGVIKSPLSPTAIARQLNQHFGFFADNTESIRVHVNNYGWFRLSNTGWAYKPDKE